MLGRVVHEGCRAVAGEHGQCEAERCCVALRAFIERIEKRDGGGDARAVLVNRIVFEPSLPSRDDRDGVADRIARFARERLTLLLADALRGFADDDVERILERIEIDLGDVPPDELERVLEEQVAAAVRMRLIERFGYPVVRGALAGGGVARGADIGAGGVRDASAFEALVGSARVGEVTARRETDEPPRTADDARVQLAVRWLEGRATLAANDADVLFGDLLTTRPRDVAWLLRQYGRHDARRERLVAALSPTTRVRAVHALRPTDARQAIGDVERFSTQHRAAPVVEMRRVGSSRRCGRPCLLICLWIVAAGLIGGRFLVRWCGSWRRGRVSRRLCCWMGC